MLISQHMPLSILTDALGPPPLTTQAVNAASAAEKGGGCPTGHTDNHSPPLSLSSASCNPLTCITMASPLGPRTPAMKQHEGLLHSRSVLLVSRYDCAPTRHSSLPPHQPSLLLGQLSTCEASLEGPCWLLHPGRTSGQPEGPLCTAQPAIPTPPSLDTPLLHVRMWSDGRLTSPFLRCAVTLPHGSGGTCCGGGSLTLALAAVPQGPWKALEPPPPPCA